MRDQSPPQPPAAEPEELAPDDYLLTFAAAWERAMDEVREDAMELAMERARRGFVSPRVYRGRFVGTIHRFDNRMALAALRYADRAAARVKT